MEKNQVLDTVTPISVRVGKNNFDSQKNLILKSRAIARTLFIIIGVLLVAHLGALYLSSVYPEDSWIVRKVDKHFNLNNEANFPTFFASLMLLFASGLLYIIYSSTKKTDRLNKRYWLLLSCFFLFMSFDEAVQIHEELNFLRHSIPSASGYLYWAWIVPYALLVIGILVYLIKFLFRLPVSIRTRFLVSGFIYVVGALVIEYIEGHYLIAYTEANKMIIIKTLYTLQELFEMIGVAMFIYALLDYIAISGIKVLTTVAEKNPLPANV